MNSATFRTARAVKQPVSASADLVRGLQTQLQLVADDDRLLLQRWERIAKDARA